MTNMYCDIPMASLRTNPYNLIQGILVKAISRAHNVNGFGTYS